MKNGFYCRLSNSINSKPHLRKTIIILNKLITGITYLLYPIAIIWICFINKYLLHHCLIVPAVGFITVSIIRKAINEQRPYEAEGFTPVIEKKTEGESFPSRHAFSVFMIAFSFHYISVPLSIMFFILGLFLAVLRVIGGVHYIRDVVAGISFAVIFAVLGMIIF